eukprot:gnl/TRDRNA2_/TRDRNA2_144998_c1_seq2.p1 gnl/TRDRNA2_/TRDRNA2_144998_c1~~gnl/TRDRNA2_/TRDRNA2_144998_c1_seq2.p1  ORF type:complete len:216 (-),score=49.72 gnl/TRDRNA2_/TRDRNA2_144998_c1_seq2:483-1130(-)
MSKWLLDSQGKEAEVGTTVGRWLDESDIVFSASARELGLHIFPRDWPAVYTESRELKGLIGKKGPCAAKRVAVVPPPSNEQEAQAANAGVTRRRLQSFLNADEVRQRLGMPVVEGWALYELQDVRAEDGGATFVAERYWWNASQGAWLDFTPRSEGIQELVLAEAASGSAAKEESVLSEAQVAFAERLGQLRFGEESDDLLTRTSSGSFVRSWRK